MITAVIIFYMIFCSAMIIGIGRAIVKMCNEMTFTQDEIELIIKKINGTISNG